MTGAILFRSPNWLGDAVLSTVVPTALARNPPGARIGVLSPRGLGDVFRRHSAVSEVLEFDAGREVDAYRRAGYDRVLLGPVSFGSAWRAWRGGVRERLGYAGSRRGFLLAAGLPAGEYRRDRHQVENYRALAALAGRPEARDEPRVELDPSWVEMAAELWDGPAGRGRVALQPGATYGPAKRWPAESFARLGRRLLDAGRAVAVLGGPGDEEVVSTTVKGIGNGVRDLSGRTPVGLLAAVLARADLLVTNDTGPMHLAAAVGTRVVALFGSTEPVWTGPRGEGHRVVRHPVECAPCFRRTCDIGIVCLKEISPERVLAEAQGILQEEVG